VDALLNQEAILAFFRLEQVVTALRGPTGCPWDIKQTPVSLKKYLQEECHELVDAIDKGDEKNICEEIGDIFFILTLLIAMFAEQDSFTSDDVLTGVVAKMIRRHPHVFGDAVVLDEQTLRAQWQRIKAEEKQCSLSPA
jgi:MazG family protein